jgi:hypothetical protein
MRPEDIKNLEYFINRNYKKYSRESLKKEAIVKGYGSDLFDEIYKKITDLDRPSPINTTSNIKNYKKEGLVLTPLEKEKLTKILNGPRSPSKGFFAPTQIMTYSFSIILLIALGGSMFSSFSLDSFNVMDPNLDGKSSSFNIGYPWIFIYFSFYDEDLFIFKFWPFIADFILYILLAYLIDLILSNSLNVIKNSIKEDIVEEKVLEKDEPEENP